MATRPLLTTSPEILTGNAAALNFHDTPSDIRIT